MRCIAQSFIQSLTSYLVFTWALPAAGVPYFPLDGAGSLPPPTVEDRELAAPLTLKERNSVQEYTEAAVVKERDEDNDDCNGDHDCEEFSELEKRKGGGGNPSKVEDVGYGGGFGSLGLLGAGGGGLGAGAISATAVIVLGVVVVAVLLAITGWLLYELWKYIEAFHNDDTKKWPIYGMDTTGNPNDGAAWSIRTFSDDGCGGYELEPHGSDPYHITSDNMTIMMTEYIDTDLNKNDKKPCESFMIDATKTGRGKKIESVAVWIGANTGLNNPGAIMVYSHPLCSVKTDSSKATAAAPNGTIPSSYSSKHPDYMQMYNGSAVLHNSYTDAAQRGQWACLKGHWRSFTVVFFKETNANVQYINGKSITAADTVPTVGKKPANDIGLARAGKPFMTNDITKIDQGPST